MRVRVRRVTVESGVERETLDVVFGIDSVIRSG